MTAQWCPREHELWEAIAAGRWPDATNVPLWTHVNTCATCRDVALVAGSLSHEHDAAQREAAPPSSAIVWWRAQVRARQEAAAAAARPITVAQGLAAAAGIGLALAVGGGVLTSVQAPLAWLAAWAGMLTRSASGVAALDPTNPWLLVPLALVAASLIFAPVAVYLITADD